MKKLFFLFLILFFSISVFGHGSEEIPEPKGYDSINPLYYLSYDNYGGAILMTLLWFGMLKGLWELTALILGRAL